MTLKNKLTCPLAIARAACIALILIAAACTTADLPDTLGPTGPQAVQLLIGPRRATVIVNQEIHFRTRHQVDWTTTGGGVLTVVPNQVPWGTLGISSSSFYAATPGSYLIHATSRIDPTLRDSAEVIVQPANLVRLRVTPESATLSPGASQSFTAEGIDSDSAVVPVVVSWSATGGAVDDGGLYTAGSAIGLHSVTATAGDLTAHAVATIMNPSTTATVQRVILSPATATVATGGAQAFSVTAQMSDGTTGPVDVTYSATGGTMTSAGLYSAGSTTGSYRVIATAANGKADTSAVTIASPSPTAPGQTPYTTAFAVPDTIQAEYFDKGGEAISYHDADVVNNGGALRTSEAVDVKTSSDVDGGYAIGWIAQGEWLEYSITVATEGSYTFQARVATPLPDRAFHLEIDGVDVTGSLAVPVTGAWNTTWATVVSSAVLLTSGSHVLRFVAGTSEFDVDYFVVTAGTPPTSPPPSPPPPPPPPPPPSGAAQPDRLWAGINANTGGDPSPGYVAQVNTHLNTLGKGLVRMGMDHMGGGTVGAGFNFATRDAAVASHRAANLVIHAPIGPRFHTSAGANMTEWQNNWRYFVAGIMQHYRGQVSYYIIDNEPDLAHATQGITTPQAMVDFTRIAFEESRRIDPTGGIKIESSPTSSPGAQYLKDMIDLGVSRYSDYIGLHSYGAQINDAHGANLGKVWEWQLAAAAASGWPIRPVADSENGASSLWWANGTVGHARWFRANWIAHKRYGYSNTLLYSFRSPSPGFNIADWTGGAIVPVQPTYDAVKLGYTTLPFGNGGFETANDKELEWAIYWDTNQGADPVEWQRAAFVTGNPTGARSGNGYLRFDTGESPNGNKVRRVVEQLTPGRTYTLTAWVKMVGGGTATLKAQGYNHLNGLQEAAQATTVRDTWQQLSVTFTPTKTWVVIGLEGTGTGAGGHVMYWDDVVLSP